MIVAVREKSRYKKGIMKGCLSRRVNEGTDERASANECGECGREVDESPELSCLGLPAARHNDLNNPRKPSRPKHLTQTSVNVELSAATTDYDDDDDDGTVFRTHHVLSRYCSGCQDCRPASATDSCSWGGRYCVWLVVLPSLLFISLACALCSLPSYQLKGLA